MSLTLSFPTMIFVSSNSFHLSTFSAPARNWLGNLAVRFLAARAAVAATEAATALAASILRREPLADQVRATRRSATASR